MVTITGYTSSSASSPQTATVMFTKNVSSALTTPFFNITSIQLSRALPGIITVNVVANSIINRTNTVLLGSLVNAWTAGGILYAQSSKPYPMMLAPSPGVTYNQQNGQPTSSFTLASTFSQTSAAGPQQYFIYDMGETAFQTSTSTVYDYVAFGIVNSTVGATPGFQLNYAADYGGMAALALTSRALKTT